MTLGQGASWAVIVAGAFLSIHAVFAILDELKRDGVAWESHYFLASEWNWRRYRPWVAHQRRGLPPRWRRVRVAGLCVMVAGFIAMVFTAR